MKDTSGPRAAIVTGAAQGIGRAIAEALLARGWRVAFADIKPAPLPKDAAAIAVRADVGREADVKRLVHATLKAFGRLDALVNNAAIANPDTGKIESLTLDRWNEFLKVNLTGAFLGAKHAAPHLRKTRGSIVNIASTRALMSEPDTEAYSTCKGGLVALTHALANSLGPDVRVNCVSPGWIHTKPAEKLSRKDHAQHPVGRVGKPEDVAALVAFLVSSDAGFVTGANVVVDGGMVRKMIYD